MTFADRQGSFLFRILDRLEAQLFDDPEPVRGRVERSDGSFEHADRVTGEMECDA